MLYRKTSPNPPTLLLRIVAVGTSTLLGVAACGGKATDSPDAEITPDAANPNSYDGGPLGVVPMPDPGPCGGHVCGVVAMQPDADIAPAHDGGLLIGLVTTPPDAAGPCNGGPCGAVRLPPDAAGDAGEPDAESKPPSACGGHPCGSVVMLPDAGDV